MKEVKEDFLVFLTDSSPKSVQDPPFPFPPFPFPLPKFLIHNEKHYGKKHIRHICLHCHFAGNGL